jgi:hypothetical protein
MNTETHVAPGAPGSMDDPKTKKTVGGKRGWHLKDEQQAARATSLQHYQAHRKDDIQKQIEVRKWVCVCVSVGVGGCSHHVCLQNGNSNKGRSRSRNELNEHVPPRPFIVFSILYCTGSN